MIDAPGNPARRSGRERRVPSKFLDGDTSSSTTNLNIAERLSARPRTNSSHAPPLPSLSRHPLLSVSQHHPNSAFSVNRFSSQAVTKVVQFVQAGVGTHKGKRNIMPTTPSQSSGSGLGSVPAVSARKKKRRRVSKSDTPFSDRKKNKGGAYPAPNWADIQVPASKTPTGPTASSPQNPLRTIVFDTTSSSEGESLSPNLPRAFLIQQHRRERATRADDSAALHTGPHIAPHHMRRKTQGWLFADVDSEPASPTAIPDVGADRVDDNQTVFTFEKDRTSPPLSKLSRDDHTRVKLHDAIPNSRPKSTEPAAVSSAIAPAMGFTAVMPHRNNSSHPAHYEHHGSSSFARASSESPPSLDFPLLNPKVGPSTSSLISLPVFSTGQAASNVSLLNVQHLQHSSPPPANQLVLSSPEREGFPVGNMAQEVDISKDNQTASPNAVQDSSPIPVPTSTQMVPGKAANEEVNGKCSVDRAIEIWNSSTAQPTFKRVRLQDIKSYLVQNPNRWVNPPNRLIAASRFQSLAEQEHWTNDTAEPTDERRVMMHDTCGIILTFAKSPTIQSIDMLLHLHPELEIVSSSYLKIFCPDGQKSWSRVVDSDVDAVTCPKSAVEDAQHNRDELRAEALALLELANTSNLSERVERQALDSMQNGLMHASGYHPCGTPVPERQKNEDTRNAAIQDVFDSDGSLSSSPKIFGLKRMQSDGRLSVDEPGKKRSKVSDVSTDDDNTFTSGIEILDGEQSPFEPLKREIFRLKHSSASSDSEEYGKDPTDYLHRTTEPVKQKSLPLKLRLRKMGNEDDSNMYERRGAEDRADSETRDISPQRTNSGEHYRTVHSRSISSKIRHSGIVPNVLLHLPLKNPTQSKSACALDLGLRVYTWNISECMKSASPVDIATVCKMCATNSEIFVYHGQDTDTWKSVCTSSDIVHWANNDAPTPRRSRRIRILDVRTSKLLPFKISPTVKSLDSFLQDRNAGVFSEQFLESVRTQTVPVFASNSVSCRATRLANDYGLVSSFKPSTGRLFRTLVTHKMIMPLRRLGHPEDVFLCDERPTLWNTVTNTIVRNDRGPAKEVLTAQLMKPSRYQVYFGQDILLDLANSQHLELVPISALAPSEIASYWSRRKKTHLTGEEMSENATIGDVLRKQKHLELYIGQDISRKRNNSEGPSFFSVVQKAIERYKHSSLGMYKQYFTLAYRGEEVTRLVQKGWIPMVVPANTRLSTALIFWDVCNGRLFSPSEKDGFNLGDFLARYEGIYEPYVGQNLSRGIAEEVRVWFEVLKWSPGCQGNAFIPILAKQKPYVPSKPVQKRARGKEKTASVGIDKGKHVRSVRASQPVSEKPIEKDRAVKPVVEVPLNVKDSKDVSEQTRSRNEPKPMFVDVAGFSDDEDVSREKFRGFLVSKKKAQDLQHLSASSRVLVRHKQTGLVLLRDESPALKNLSRFLTNNSDYEIYDEYSCSSVGETRSGSVTGPDETDVFIRAKLAGRRAANDLQFMIGEILHTTRIGDPLQRIKESIEEELSKCGNFSKLLGKLRSGEFVSLAEHLLDLLEALDVYNFFTEDSENMFGTPDFLSIRDKLHLGSSFLVHDAMKGFREVCAAVIQYNPAGTISHEEVMRIYPQGEQVYASFFDDNLETMRADSALFKIRELAADAVRQMEASSFSKCRFPEEHSREALPTRAKIFQRNPYLNYRDDAGYSHMGKPQSARVLGLLIDDDQSCLKDIERHHWAVNTNCHLCSKRITDVYSNSLPCANRLYGTCQRIVCRGCLQRNQKLDADTFVAIRASGTWHCVHCTGACRRQKRACSKNDTTVSDPNVREISFAFDAGDVDGEASIEAVFARCQRNGVFESFEQGVRVSGTEGHAVQDGIWRCSTKLEVGSYRVRMDVGGEWFTSSILHVFPSHSGTEQCAGQPKDGLSNATRLTDMELDPSRCFRQPTVKWEEGSSTGEGNVVSLRSGPIRESSRTEGYNWTSSKRHKIKRWRPKVDGCIPEQLPTIITTNAEPFLPEGEVMAGGSSSGLFTSIMVKEKKRYSDFSKELTARKYDKMLKHSLWGLVVCRSMIHGSGLFTVSGYGKGDLIVEYAGDLIRTPIADLREAQYEAAGLGTYLFKVNESHIVDATVRSNRARFVNHCCDPNMAAEIISVRGRDLVVLRAIRPIPPFSELTFDYQLPLEEKKLQCQCKSWNCKGVMN